MLLPDMPKFPLYELSCIVFFAIPMLVILVLYTRMGLKIKRATKEALGSIQGSYIHGDHRRVQSRKSVIKMLSTTVLIFSPSNNLTAAIIEKLASEQIYIYNRTAILADDNSIEYLFLFLFSILKILVIKH